MGSAMRCGQRDLAWLRYALKSGTYGLACVSHGVEAVQEAADIPLTDASDCLRSVDLDMTKETQVGRMWQVEVVIAPAGVKPQSRSVGAGSWLLVGQRWERMI